DPPEPFRGISARPAGRRREISLWAACAKKSRSAGYTTPRHPPADQTDSSSKELCPKPPGWSTGRPAALANSTHLSPVKRPSRPRTPPCPPRALAPAPRPGPRGAADGAGPSPGPGGRGLGGGGGGVMGGRPAGVEGRFLTARAGGSIVDR